MLIRKVKYLHVWLVVIGFCAFIPLFFRYQFWNSPGLWVLSSSGRRAWIYKGPDAQDKAVIVAKIKTDDVSWIFDQLQEYLFLFTPDFQSPDSHTHQLATCRLLHGRSGGWSTASTKKQRSRSYGISHLSNRSLPRLADIHGFRTCALGRLASCMAYRWRRLQQRQVDPISETRIPSRARLRQHAMSS